jgi:hypothetical protein
MFTKNKVSQSMIDAVNEVTKLDEASPIKEPTPTGMRVYGRNYGNSAKAKQDQTKSDLDKVKGPKDKEMKEELKGDQHKIDANKNNKVDAHDFAILRGKKKVKESFSTRLAEKYKTMKEKKDVVMPEALEKSPAKNTDVADKSYLKDKPGSVKSDLKNLGRFLTGKKETNEEVELNEDNLGAIAKKHGMELKRTTYGAGMKHPTHGEVSINRYGEWNHKGKTGDSSNKFSSLDKHLSSLKEGADSVPFDGPYTKTPSNVKDKSGAIHTPMSRAKDLARLAFKKVQDKTKIDK